jgi:DNA adenine methylase
MKIKSILPYFGAKRTIAGNIVELFGDVRSYWEPFCGSLSVLFAKKPSANETVNDLYGDVVNLARVIAGDGAPAIYERLSRTLYSEEIFDESAIRLAVETQPFPDMERAYWFFINSWMGRNGVVGQKRSTCSFSKRYTTSGGCSAVRFTNAVESIPDWHYRLRNVTILNSDAFHLLPKIEDKSGTLIYADPPYIKEGKTYRHGLTEAQHGELALALRRFARTRVVLSYYADPSLSDLYPGWETVPVAAKKRMAIRAGNGDVQDAPEVLLLNF